MTEKPYVLAVDPGLTNGVCLVSRDPLENLWSAELDWKELYRQVNTKLHEFGGENVDVVVEKFIITPNTGKLTQAPWSMYVIGQMMALAWQHGCTGKDGSITLQKAGDAMEFAPNSRLRALGLWHKGGAGHAKVALKHALLFLVNTGYRDPRLLG